MKRLLIKCNTCRRYFFRHQPTPADQSSVIYGLDNADITECTECLRYKLLIIPGDIPGGWGDILGSRLAPPRQSFIGTLATLKVPINYKNYDRKIDRRLSNAKKITLGDLHGNTMTLFIILLKCEALVAKNPVTAEHTFNLISAIVIKATNGLLEAGDYRDFRKLIDEFDVNPLAPSLRLIGDVLADRVSNDALTTALLYKLIRAGKIDSIIYSNHDNEFFIFLAFCGAEPVRYGVNEPQVFLASHINWCKFLKKMAGDVNNVDIISHMLESIKAYIDVIKMFDYEYPVRAASSTIPSGHLFCLYTHAAFDWHTFNACIQLLCGPREFLPQIDQFMTLIQEANVRLRSILGAVFTKVDDFLNGRREKATVEEYMTSEFARLFAESGRPGFEAIWYRWDESSQLSPPPFHNFFNVHGHDQNSPPYSKSYDQLTGKSIEYLQSGQTFMLELEILT